MNLIELYNTHVNNYVALLNELNENKDLSTEQRADYLIKMNLSCNAATMFAMGAIVNLIDFYLTNTVVSTNNNNEQQIANANDLGLE